MFSEDELLPLSALQHLLFCERQCALIHLEQTWSENRLTVEGKNLHAKVHEADDESRGDLRIARGLRLRSLRLGLTGQADVVEFRRAPGAAPEWLPFPVEYKRGKPKADDCDKAQLCAQALCLEEMLQTSIPAGALFYGAPRRREDVEFTAELRSRTEAAAARLHALFERGETPPAGYAKKCDHCSLIQLCLPKTLERRPRVERYLASALEDEKTP